VVIGLTCSFVGALFDTYAFYRYQNLRGDWESRGEREQGSRGAGEQRRIPHSPLTVTERRTLYRQRTEPTSFGAFDNLLSGWNKSTNRLINQLEVKTYISLKFSMNRR
jgi:hypothetical protein